MTPGKNRMLQLMATAADGQVVVLLEVVRVSVNAHDPGVEILMETGDDG